MQAKLRVETSKTKQTVRTVGMSSLKVITGHALRDIVPSREIISRCSKQDINKLIKCRRKYWNKHIGRMQEIRIPRILRDKKPEEKQDIGRPRKGWAQNWLSPLSRY